MAALAGLVPQVTDVVTNAVTLHVDLVPASQAAAAGARPAARAGHAGPRPAVGDPPARPAHRRLRPTRRARAARVRQPRLRGRELHLRRRARRPVAPREPLGRHARVDQPRVRLGADLVLPPDRRVRAAGHLVAVDDTVRGLPDDFLAAAAAPRPRFTLLAGAENRCFLPSGQRRTHAWLNAPARAPRRRVARPARLLAHGRVLRPRRAARRVPADRRWLARCDRELPAVRATLESAAGISGGSLSDPRPVGPRAASGPRPAAAAPPDDQLVALFRMGYDEAFDVIVDRYRQRLFAYTRRMLGGSRSDAEDALQDVFLSAYGALRHDDRPVTLRAWLYRVAHNRCIDQIRRPLPAAGRGPRRSPARRCATRSSRPSAARTCAGSSRTSGACPSSSARRCSCASSRASRYAEIADALGHHGPGGQVAARARPDRPRRGRRGARRGVRGHPRRPRARPRPRRADQRALAPAPARLRGCREYRPALRGLASARWPRSRPAARRRSRRSPSSSASAAPASGAAVGAGAGPAAAAGRRRRTAATATATKVVAVVCCAAVVGGGAAEVRQQARTTPGPAHRAARHAAATPRRAPPPPPVAPSRRRVARGDRRGRRRRARGAGHAQPAARTTRPPRRPPHRRDPTGSGAAPRRRRRHGDARGRPQHRRRDAPDEVALPDRDGAPAPPAPRRRARRPRRPTPGARGGARATGAGEPRRPSRRRAAGGPGRRSRAAPAAS